MRLFICLLYVQRIQIKHVKIKPPAIWSITNQFNRSLLFLKETFCAQGWLTNQMLSLMGKLNLNLYLHLNTLPVCDISFKEFY